MKVYTNNSVRITIENQDNLQESYETYIFTENGIYKKYKKHFFLCELKKNKIPHPEVVSIDNKQFFIELDELEINKQKLLTSLPFNCFFVNRLIKRCCLEENVEYIKEIDNDNYESSYFVINDIESIKNIGLYVE
tara:strand:+ start:11905 stop:12309 length:405 start_codon:yes stop_codon:yes gene_type:complete